MRQRRFSVLVAAILLLLTGCGGQRGGDNAGSAAEPTSCEVAADARLSIATETGSKLKATVAETSASVQNIQQLVAGTHQIALSLADTAVDAVNGTASFT